MRKAILYLLLFGVLAFYVGSGAAAAMPYYGAVTNFIHVTTAPIPTGRPTHMAATVKPHVDTQSRQTPAATATAAPSPTPRATSQAVHGLGPSHKPAPTTRQLAAAVQHLAAHTKVPHGRVNFLVLG